MEQGNQPEAVVFAEYCRSSRLLFLYSKSQRARAPPELRFAQQPDFRFRRELRKGNKLTQEKLAEELNITDSHLRRIESGTRTGSIDLLIDIAAYFEVSMDYLLLGKVDQSGKVRAELREVQKQLKRITAML